MVPPRRAAFVAVGSELLRAGRMDTNSLLVARLLARCGFALVEKRVIEDDADAIASCAREMAGRVELVVFSGGLGPTADDVTREGVARALGLGITRSEAMEKALEARYRKSGRVMPPIAGRMADILDGAEVLPNPRGTAPGQLVVGSGTSYVLLPGVPVELEEIFRGHLLRRWECASRLAVRTLHLGGVYESDVEERVSPLYERFGRENVTILAQRGQVDLVLTASGDGASQRLDVMDAAFSAVAGADLFGRDEATLAGTVLGLARRRSWRLAVAESCTGGMIGARLTSVPGASDVFVGGVVAYSNEVKESVLNVSPAVIAERGAVSREAAEAMASGARRLGAECALAITGVAGPTGGTEEKPVGTVHMAVVSPAGVVHRVQRFPGDRDLVRALATTFALDVLRRALEAAP
ncbi:MAG: CinA family nicotinamide mononucleotide deamidase-related protein [Acidobacteriota bacterium]